MLTSNDDTIAAIATPIGLGGVGIVRLSGPDAVSIAAKLFRPSGRTALGDVPSHLMVHGWIESGGAVVDEAMAVCMRGPRSYTTEDVVELQCHGGALVLRTVLESACAAGARLALPGEFTLRAFANGRIDLTRAEAVADIVKAGSQFGLEASANQLRGKLYRAIRELKEHMAHVAALLAAGIDFPEEDVVFAHRGEILDRLTHSRDGLDRLIQSAGQGRMLREGIVVAIIGKPNVGKSSLLNALLRENRAIVTDMPGTTRDTLEESCELGGLMLRLIDTAGIRESEHPVEREGVLRSRAALAQADLVLLVLDGCEPLSQQDESLIDEADSARTIAVLNKLDRMTQRPPQWVHRVAHLPHVPLSALTGEGMDSLEESVRYWALDDERPQLEHALITNLRQEQAARQAVESIENALEGVNNNLGDELLAIDLGRALDALGDIVGETTTDDLLERIFAEFCIGK